MKILVVEDDFASRRMMQKMLEAYGDVDVVVDGVEALEAFQTAWEDSTPYNLIFMDIMMPKMDGSEAIQKIRALELQMGITPVDEVKIFMTSVMDDPRTVMQSFQQGGAAGYFVKPVDIQKLRAELADNGITPKAK
jgi:two-component system, chemotaxis family, chemotaxis protein CheY